MQYLLYYGFEVHSNIMKPLLLDISPRQSKELISRSEGLIVVPVDQFIHYLEIKPLIASHTTYILWLAKVQKIVLEIYLQ